MYVCMYAKGYDVIINIISANQHFASTFLMQIFKLQRRSCKLSFLFPSRRQSAPWRACSQVTAALAARTKLATPFGNGISLTATTYRKK